MKQLRKHLRLAVMILAMAATLAIPGFAADIWSFSDVDAGAWYGPTLDYAAKNGLINGTSAITFSPSDSMTRAQFITVVCRAFEGEETTGSQFADVAPNQYYAGPVYWGVAHGIITGTSDTTFSPNSPITREAMAAIIARAIVNLDLDVPQMQAPMYDSFGDAALVSDWAKDAVEQLRQLGILQGDQNGNVNPKKKMTRAEGTAVLARVVAAMQGDTLETPAVPEWVNLYGSILTDTFEVADGSLGGPVSFQLIDLNRDGTPELILNLDVDTTTTTQEVYALTKQDGQWLTQQIFSARAYHASLSYGKKTGVLMEEYTFFGNFGCYYETLSEDGNVQRLHQLDADLIGGTYTLDGNAITKDEFVQQWKSNKGQDTFLQVPFFPEDGTELTFNTLDAFFCAPNRYMTVGTVDYQDGLEQNIYFFE